MSTATAKTNAQKQASPFPEFPAIAWRGLFAKYRDRIAPTTESPPEFLFGALLGALSVLVARTATLPWGSGQMPPVVLVALIGETAKARKSTAIDDVVETIVGPLMPKATRPGEPAPMELLIGSGSGEGFVEALADRRWKPVSSPDNDEPEEEVQTHRRALYVVHEFAALLAKIRKDQAGSMIDFMINVFDARNIWTHRTRSKGNQSSSLTITGGIGVFLVASTIQWIVENLTETQVLAGLANRFLWLGGIRQKPLHRRPKIDQAVLDELRYEVEKVLPVGGAVEYQLDDEADKLHAAKYEADFYKDTSSEIVAAAGARGDVLALRVALLLAIADGEKVIKKEHIEAGWAVIEYSRSVVEILMGRIHARSMHEVERRVVAAAGRIIETGVDSFTRREVWQRLKGSHSGLDSELFARAFASLVDAGDIAPNGAANKFRLVSS